MLKRKPVSYRLWLEDVKWAESDGEDTTDKDMDEDTSDDIVDKGTDEDTGDKTLVGEDIGSGIIGDITDGGDTTDKDMDKNTSDDIVDRGTNEDIGNRMTSVGEDIGSGIMGSKTYGGDTTDKDMDKDSSDDIVDKGIDEDIGGKTLVREDIGSGIMGSKTYGGDTTDKDMDKDTSGDIVDKGTDEDIGNKTTLVSEDIGTGIMGSKTDVGDTTDKDTDKDTSDDIVDRGTDEDIGDKTTLVGEDIGSGIIGDIIDGGDTTDKDIDSDGEDFSEDDIVEDSDSDYIYDSGAVDEDTDSEYVAEEELAEANEGGMDIGHEDADGMDIGHEDAGGGNIGDENTSGENVGDQDIVDEDISGENSYGGKMGEESAMCCHEELDEDHIERDKNHRGIYVSKRLKSDVTQTGIKKKTNRVYNNYHCCFLCRKHTTNILKHLRTHKENYETRELVELKKSIEGYQKDEDIMRKKRYLSNKQILLRCRGDHQHNIAVKEAGSGVMIIARKQGQFNMEDYGPCPLCLEWIRIESFSKKHQSSCAKRRIDEESREQEGHDGPVSLHWLIRKIPTCQTLQYLANWF